MNFFVDPSIVKKLIPTLSEKDKQNIKAYYAVMEKYEKEVSEKALDELKEHPVFGKLIRETPKEVSEANNKISRGLQKGAIYRDEWEPYIEYQVVQGITYAKMGLDFKSWYDLISMARNYIVPYLKKELGTGMEFIDALNGLNMFMDVAMGILGEAYVQEKKQIIESDQEKIKKLNEDLEKKVAERTVQLEKSNAYIKESEQKYRELFNSIDEGYCIIEMIFDKNNKPVDYRFLVINAAFEKQTGLVDAVGRRMREFAPDHEEHWFETYGNIALTGQSMRFVNRAEQLNRWYDVYAFRFGDPADKQVAVLFNDITERKRSEEIIQQLNTELAENLQRLEAANKELEAFTYSVSHDLRAPLRAISGYSEMMHEDYGSKLDEECNRILDSISRNATRMGTLIDELLAFSRLGKKEPQKSMVNMNDLVEDVVSELSRLTQHMAKVKIGKLQNVNADYGLMRQVVFNLISNAVKYSSKKPKPVVEVTSEKKNGEIIFAVKDNGAGFDMQYADKLFGVFQRLHTDEEFEGTGVGLAIVQRLVNKHNGKVWADAKVGEGATFYFSLSNN